jgi:hypothetical protein
MLVETNINELLNTSNISIEDLTYSSSIEDSISQNGGTVIYSYNNIIIASEISEAFYNELQKNPNIDYIESVALKQYGSADSNQISNLDSNNQYLPGNSNDITTLKGVVNVNNSNIDGSSGNVYGSNITGIGPTILNSIFTLSASTNEIFNYTIITSGSTPIDFSIVQPITYDGVLILKNINTINGQTSKAGIYNIKFLANNNFGTDVKYLTLSITEPTKILNTNLLVYNNFNSQFYYTIESSGENLTYDILNMPGGLFMIGNIINGYFSTIDTYIMTLIISGTTGSDSVILTVNVGEAPIINSYGDWSIEQNNYQSYQNYYITSTTADSVYNVIGILPQGLYFSNNIISGVAAQSGEYHVTLLATNPYGENSKDLKITVVPMGQYY